MRASSRKTFSLVTIGQPPQTGMHPHATLTSIQKESSVSGPSTFCSSRVLTLIASASVHFRSSQRNQTAP